MFSSKHSESFLKSDFDLSFEECPDINTWKLALAVLGRRVVLKTVPKRLSAFSYEESSEYTPLEATFGLLARGVLRKSFPGIDFGGKTPPAGS